MTDQYLRKCSLTVSNSQGAGLDLSEMQVKFSTRQADIQTPAALRARIYNLSNGNAGSTNTVLQIEKEFTHITLQAGYQQGNFGTIFQGEIKQTLRGRENATDTYLDIYAANGDQAYQFAVVSATLAAGWSDSDVVDACINAMKPYGITRGYISGLKSTKHARGVTLDHSARQILRDIAVNNNLTWSIANNQLQMVPMNSYLPSDPVVLTSATGMIGVPQQTQDGIHVTSLLNPNLVTAARVKIDNASINRTTVLRGGTGPDGTPLVSSDPAGFYVPYDQWTGINYLASISADSLYRILVSEHSGNTRGNDWYTKLTCVGTDDSVPPSLVQRGLS